MSQILPPKKDVALALLERASVFVHLDPRGVGVVVPMHFKKQPRLVLQIGLNMAVPIPDLRLDDQGLSCTLSFNRSLFHCVVPWSGIFALVGEDGRGMVWPEDVPQEIAREMSPQKDEGKTDGSPAAPIGGTGGPTGIAGGRKRPQMSLVSSPSADPKRPSKRAGSGSKSPAADARRKRDDTDKPTLFKVGDGDGHGKPSKPSKPTQIGRHTPSAPSAKDARGRSAVDRAEEKPSDKSKGEDHGSAKPAGAGQPSAPPSPPTPSTAPRTPGSSPPGKRSPKRELPPYLRVVK